MTRVARPKRGPRGAAPVPEFIQPCLATLTARPPAGDTWIHEIKLDGYRLQVRIADGAVELRTRSGLDWTARFGPLALALADFPATSAIIDGEAIVEDASGVPDFPALVEALKRQSRAPIVFVAFDLLHLDGEAWCLRPLLERKASLAPRVQALSSARIRFSQHVDGDGDAILRHACRMGLEGIVSKRIDLPYRSGRNSDWLKSKCVSSAEFVIGGMVPSTAMSGAVGALALGYYSDGGLVYVGRVGTGFTHGTAKDLWRDLLPLAKNRTPFATPIATPERRGVLWLEPLRVAAIAYRAWTGDGRLRHASFVALREDKPAHEVTDPRK